MKAASVRCDENFGFMSKKSITDFNKLTKRFCPLDWYVLLRQEWTMWLEVQRSSCYRWMCWTTQQCSSEQEFEWHLPLLLVDFRVDTRRHAPSKTDSREGVRNNIYEKSVKLTFFFPVREFFSFTTDLCLCPLRASPFAFSAPLELSFLRYHRHSERALINGGLLAYASGTGDLSALGTPPNLQCDYRRPEHT